MTGLPSDKRDGLLRLLDKEAALLSELERQTELQSRFLSEGDVDMLNITLDKRQKTIEKLDRLHQETEVLMQSYMSVPDGDDEIDTRRAAVAEAIRKVLARDSEIQAAMKAVAAGYSKEIRKLSDGIRGLGGYKFVDDGHSGLFDKKT